MRFFLWFVYFPIFKILSSLIFWHPKIKERKNFEAQNHKDPLCKSFRESGFVADICFEFSSEGEYQQVASMIDDGLKAGKKIELVFFSPSVEKTIVSLAHKHPSQLRYMRYSLINFTPLASFSRWITSKHLVLVRYDLFPEFLAWASRPGNGLTMVWMTFKKERGQNKPASLMKRMFLKRSQKIIYASEPDQEMGTNIGFPGPCYDFRMEQIRRRVSIREDKFKTIFAAYAELKANWESYPPHKRLIIGNAWPSDLFLFDNIPEDFFVLIVPHKLEAPILKAFNEAFTKLGRKVVEVSDGVSPGDTFILNKKGVLCELYADFGFAYVGGGFEAGVHSILEPLVAGSEFIACGLSNNRSTEFDVAKSLGRMTEVGTPSEFLQWITRDHIINSDRTLAPVFEKYEKYRKEVISC